ncbi:cupredoxin domain-containing protein [Candidatus Nitrosocosmicus arcticus]|uniref:cupredoxin domain-containing protein n=1 Tax=Candidatus Nitrosocosmicus arcticus TaxID=2035267 RepID=UPI001C94A3E4|nr:cupredoxin domain-containing protein [Candidatus Nitrosocosmicus arcticus]
MSFSFIVILGLLTYTTISQSNNGEFYNHISLAQEQSPPLTNSTLVDLIGTGILGPPTNKTIYLFNSENEGVNETQLNIPPDSFSPSAIAANTGDTVNIKFYNLEEPDGDRHSFTVGAPYGLDKDIAPGQTGTVTFKATEGGTFVFFCKYHQPTMRGELIVLP